MSTTAIDIGSLVQILGEHVDPEQKKAILEDIKKVLKEEEEEKDKEQGEKPPKIEKKKIIILTAIPEGMTERDVSELAGFLTEIPEDEPARELVSAMRSVRRDYNETKKAKKNPADSMSALFENAPTKLFKEHGVLKKPAGPLEFIHIPNRTL